MHACKYTILSKKEQNALQELEHREIVLTSTDKGVTVVILEVKDYTKESERQSNDTEHCKHPEHDPTTESNATVNKVITRFRNDNLISSNVSVGVKVKSPRTPRFYIQ